MPVFRVQCSHYIREFIDVDVEAPSAEAIKEKSSDIYAAACDLTDWDIDYDAGPNDDNVRIHNVDGVEVSGLLGSVEPAERFDTEGSAKLVVTERGVEVRTIAAKDPPFPGIARTVEIVLEKYASCRMHNPEDAKTLRDALVAALSPEES